MPSKFYNLDIDNTLSNNSDNLIASQKAVKSYVDTGLSTKQDTLTAGTGIDISNNVIALKGTQILTNGTDIDTLTTEGSYFIKNPTSTLGLPTLPTGFPSQMTGISDWILLLKVEKDTATMGTTTIRQIAMFTPMTSIPNYYMSSHTFIYSRFLNDYIPYGAGAKTWSLLNAIEIETNVGSSLSTSAIITPFPGYTFICSQLNSINSLTINTTTYPYESAYEYRVIFKPSSTFTLTASQLTFLNQTTPTFVANTIHILTVKNGYARIDYVGDNPVYATKNELTSKQDTLVSGTNIKTINNQSILGSGNIEIQSGGEITEYKFNNISGITLDTQITLSSNIIVFRNGQKIERTNDYTYTAGQTIITFTRELYNETIVIWNSVSSIQQNTVWGDIVGNIEDQTDLKNALSSKQNRILVERHNNISGYDLIMTNKITNDTELLVLRNGQEIDIDSDYDIINSDPNITKLRFNTELEINDKIKIIIL